MHPSDHELIRYARLSPGERSAQDQVSFHLGQCAACREELALIEDWVAAANAQGTAEHSAFEELAIRLLRKSSHIALRPLDMSIPVLSQYSLAADGVPAVTAGLKHRATLYSEVPEVVLRVMYDPATQRDFLQLTAEDPSLTSHVYIHLAEPPMEFLTNELGVAEMPSAALENPEALSWRLQLPDASFTLKPLESSSPAEETVIDLPEGNRVAIQFIQDAAGVSLRVRPLRIQGQDTIERVRVVVCQSGGRWQAVDTRTPGECVAANLSPDSPIEIRLFVIE